MEAILDVATMGLFISLILGIGILVSLVIDSRNSLKRIQFEEAAMEALQLLEEEKYIKELTAVMAGSDGEFLYLTRPDDIEKFQLDGDIYIGEL